MANYDFYGKKEECPDDCLCKADNSYDDGPWGSAFLLGLVCLFVLFWGEPDIVDWVITFLKK